MRLPAGGRQGKPPPWPLSRAFKREVQLWQRLWHTPQAVAWERLGWTDVIARYARLLVFAEQPGAPTPTLAEVRQMEDRLGLTPMSMLRLRWAIDDDELEDQVGGKVVDIRQRLRAVE